MWYNFSMYKLIMAINTLRDTLVHAKVDAQYAGMARDKETRDKYLKSVDKDLMELQLGLAIINRKLLQMDGQRKRVL